MLVVYLRMKIYFDYKVDQSLWHTLGVAFMALRSLPVSTCKHHVSQVSHSNALFAFVMFLSRGSQRGLVRQDSWCGLE